MVPTIARTYHTSERPVETADIVPARCIYRVQLHADLTILAQLASALLTART